MAQKDALTALRAILSRKQPHVNQDELYRLIGGLTNSFESEHRGELVEILLGFRTNQHQGKQTHAELEQEITAKMDAVVNRNRQGKSGFDIRSVFKVFKALGFDNTTAENKALMALSTTTTDADHSEPQTPLEAYQDELIDLDEFAEFAARTSFADYMADFLKGNPPETISEKGYLARKGLSSFSGLAFEMRGCTFVPSQPLTSATINRDEVGSYQMIAQNSKSFKKGFPSKGNVHFLPNKAANYTANTILLCEGLATGETLHQATGIPTLCLLSKWNLSLALLSLIEYGTASKILICADTDNDATKLAEKWLNIARAGIEAKGTSQKVGYVLPNLTESNKDFNDLMVLEGMDAVKAAIDQALIELDDLDQTVVNAPTKATRTKSKDDADALEKFVLERNRTHAKVKLGGKVRIMHAREVSVLIGESYEKHFRHDFESLQELILFASHEPKFKVGDKLVNRVAAWTSHKNVRAFSEVVFEPYNTFDKNSKYIKSEDAYNLWQGYGVVPRNHGLTYPYLSRLIYKICAGNPEWLNYLYDWIAIGYQKPQSKVGVALCIRGGEGSGKGSLLHFLRKLWGNHGGYVSNGKQVTGNFNGHLAALCYLFADEAIFAGDKAAANAIKSLITEDIIAIERKGLDVTQERNYLRIAMASNHDWMLDASADARRFCIFDLNKIPDDDVFLGETIVNSISPQEDKHGYGFDNGYFIGSDWQDYDKTNDGEIIPGRERARIQAKNFYKELHAELERTEIKEQFLFDMLTRDVTEFIPNRNIPQTNVLKEQKLHTLSGDSIAMWLLHFLREDGGKITEVKEVGENMSYTDHYLILPEVGAKATDGIPSKMLYDNYIAYCRKVDVRGFKLIDPVHFGRYLSAKGVLNHKGRDSAIRAVKHDFLKTFADALGIDIEPV